MLLYFLMKGKNICKRKTRKKTYNPANISTLDQLCYNVVDQRWNNVDPTMKTK